MAANIGDSIIETTFLQKIEYEDSKGRKLTINLYTVLANKWDMVCDLIGFSIHDKMNIKEQFPANPMKCIQTVMERWILAKDKYKRYPCTWNGICKLLTDIQVSTVSEELKEALKATKSSFGSFEVESTKHLALKEKKAKFQGIEADSTCAKSKNVQSQENELDSPASACDNSFAERAIRPIPIRRRKRKPTVNAIVQVLNRGGFPAAKCEDLGIALNVQCSELQDIYSDRRGSVKSQLSSIINHWLSNNEEASWEKLAGALELCGYRVLANNIREGNVLHTTQDDDNLASMAKDESPIVTPREVPAVSLSPIVPPKRLSICPRIDGGKKINTAVVVFFIFVVMGAYLFLPVYSWLRILLYLGGIAFVAIVAVLLVIRFCNGNHSQVNANRANSQGIEGDAITTAKEESHLYTSNEVTEEVTPKPTTDTESQDIRYIFQDIEYFNEITSEPYFGLDFRQVHGVGIEGRGVKIAIIDACDDAKYDEGIFEAHKALQTSSGRINLVRLGCGSHTNHALTCTSIAVGESIPEAIYVKKGRVAKVEYPGGIAPKASATLFLINAHNRSTVLEALNLVIQGNFDVLSMSFVYYEQDDDFKQRLDQLNGRTIVVAAAGNNGNSDEVGYPARHADVISVGSLNTKFKISSFSPENEDVDIYYPGEVMSPVNDTTSTLKFSTGTSVATPGVAGIVCLLIEIANHHNCKVEMKEKMKAISLLKHVVITERHGVYRRNTNFLRKAYADENLFKQAMLDFSTNSAK